jgi:spoIIIJ-associated protein
VEWIVTTGRTTDEAKESALDQLGVSEDDAEFEVVDEPKTGLFGRLRTEARVRARVRPVQPPPKADRKRSEPRRQGRRAFLQSSVST